MKETVKFIIIKAIRIMMRLFWIFPVRSNRIVFMAFNAKQYACNPKYISEYLHKQYGSSFEMIWVFDQPEKFSYLQDKRITLVKNKTFRFFYDMATAHVIVTNTGLPSYLVFKKKQVLINTWHGSGAYKRCGIDIDIDNVARKKLQMAAKDTDYMISGCRKFSEVMSHSIMLPIEKMLEVGMPRNDVLMTPHPELVKKVKEYYHILDDTHIVLYAPTYRGSTLDAEKEDESLQIEDCLSALSERFGGQWIAFYRVHYFLTSSIPATEQVIDVSTYPDMQELLCAADVLITDYSSSMWDMSLTGKPCFIYATDIADYQQERDFYTPMKEWPFPVAQNNDELEFVIKNFDQQKYADDIKCHHDALGSRETGHASQTVGDFIYQKCFVDNKQKN